MNLTQKRYFVAFTAISVFLILSTKDSFFVWTYIYNQFVSTEDTPSVVVYELTDKDRANYGVAGDVEGDTIVKESDLIEGSFENVPITFKYPNDWTLYNESELINTNYFWPVPGSSSQILVRNEHTKMSVNMFLVSFNAFPNKEIPIPMTCNYYSYSSDKKLFIRGALNTNERNCIYDSLDSIELNSTVGGRDAFTQYKQAPTPSIIPVSEDFYLYVVVTNTRGMFSAEHGENLPIAIKLILDSINVGTID